MSPHVRTAASLVLVLLAQHAAAAPVRIAVIGGGIGGTAAAHLLRQLQPSWQLELFERERIGGRTEELFLDGRTLELGASIIHAQNQYALSLAREVGLTPVKGDDTGNAFSIYNGSSFVFSQVGSQVRDVFAVLKRYGVTPLRYKWLAEEMGRRFGRIYELQRAGRAFDTPEQLWGALGLFNVTQQSAADYMQAHLSQGLFRYGSAAFIEELAGAINRINYNQHNQGMNALAGLVSYLPAAEPEVYSIQEGNAALPRKLAAAAKLQAVHVGVAVQAVRRDDKGQYTLLATQPAEPIDDADGAAAAQLESQEEFGPFDGVVLAAPLEGSGIQLQGVLQPGASLPKRVYQTTVTTYVTGVLNPAYFKVPAVPAGDIFVTDSAGTPFSVIASKGALSGSAANTACTSSTTGICQAAHEQEQKSKSKHMHQAHWQQPKEQQEQQQLWKMFSQEPLSEDLLQQLFINGSTVIISKAWKAYPRFHPPEVFAPFALSPGLCYSNALENGASAMEVSAVAAMNCALLLQQQLGQGAAGTGNHRGGAAGPADDSSGLGLSVS